MSRDYFIEWRIVLADPETAEPGERYANPGWGAGTRITFPDHGSSAEDILSTQHTQLLGNIAAIRHLELERTRRHWWQRLIRRNKT